MRQNCDVTMTLMTLCVGNIILQNAKIGLGLCVFYACEFQTMELIVVKFSDIFYAQLSCSSK